MISCPKCDTKVIHVGDDSLDEYPEYPMMSIYICPACNTTIQVNWSEDEDLDS